jgi:hypothetical protein
MKKIYLLAILALLISSPACSSSSDQSDGGEFTARPTGRIYFQDNFSNETTGWPRVRTDEGITDYEDGVYRIFVNLDNDDYFATPGLTSLPNDVRVEVDATKVAGSDNNDFGILCRYQDNNNVYQFVVSSDGYVGILKLVDGSMQSIAAETLIESSAVNVGNTQNHIRADCIGEMLALYVNGQQVSTAQDTTFLRGGEVGVFAGTYDTPGTDIHFDNFIVTVP